MNLFETLIRVDLPSACAYLSADELEQLAGDHRMEGVPILEGHTCLYALRGRVRLCGRPPELSADDVDKVLGALP